MVILNAERMRPLPLAVLALNGPQLVSSWSTPGRCAETVGQGEPCAVRTPLPAARCFLRGIFLGLYRIMEKNMATTIS